MDKKEKLSKKIKNEKTSDDVLLAILINVLGVNDFAPYDPIVIHQILYEFKSRDKGHKKLLKDFTFNTSGITPTSEEIVNVFSRLGIANILNLTTSAFDKFTIRSKKSLTRRVKRKLSEKEFNMTKEIAKEIRKRSN